MCKDAVSKSVPENQRLTEEYRLDSCSFRQSIIEVPLLYMIPQLPDIVLHTYHLKKYGSVYTPVISMSVGGLSALADIPRQ